MGTNFYWRDKPCDHCGRYEEIHVGKKSAGWSFSFQAWPHQLMDDGNPDWGYHPSSPFGFPVLSRAGWRKVFTERPGELWDQYDERVDDPLAWLGELEPPNLTQQRWEDDHRGPYASDDPDRYWRDAEGFRFHTGEFS